MVDGEMAWCEAAANRRHETAEVRHPPSDEDRDTARGRSVVKLEAAEGVLERPPRLPESWLLSAHRQSCRDDLVVERRYHDGDAGINDHAEALEEVLLKRQWPGQRRSASGWGEDLVEQRIGAGRAEGRKARALEKCPSRQLLGHERLL